MPKRIMVFVKTKWIVKPFDSQSKAWVWGGYPPEHRFEKHVSRDDASAMRIAKEVAEEYGLELKIYDLASIRGWFSAKINKVKNTPTIIIGNNRIEGVPNKSQLLRMVNP